MIQPLHIIHHTAFDTLDVILISSDYFHTKHAMSMIYNIAIQLLGSWCYLIPQVFILKQIAID